MQLNSRGKSFLMASLLLLPLSLHEAREGYAGGEPAGTRILERPRMGGDATLLHDAANNRIAASVIGVCRGHSFTMGPFFFSLMDTFDAFLEDVESGIVFIPSTDFPELFNVHPSCFRDETANLVGFQIIEVVRSTRHNADFVTGRIVLKGVVPE